MKCRNCGAEMSDYHVFCTNCGKPLDMGGEPSPRPAPRPAPAPVPDPVPDPIPDPAPDPIPDPVPAPARIQKKEKKRREKSPTTAQKLPNKALLIAAISLVGAAVLLLAVMLVTSGSRDRHSSQPGGEIAVEEPAEQTAEATAVPTPTPTPEPTPDPEYILPDSSTKYLSNADLQGLSWEELCLARNEIFARHGRIFKTPEIAQYFSEKSWYEGTIAPERFNDSVLSAIEKANVQLIVAYENANYGGSYY